ncbi:hypothetical protein LTR08_000219 [Meristemomyces frigidus]|nr:hypothetical protein LTR08_000219 [Meristemomyces frigidus]
MDNPAPGYSYRPQAYTMSEIPRFIASDLVGGGERSRVQQCQPNEGPPAMALPLNLVALIVSYLDDDIGTLARLTRSSRLLYYMSLPQLYQRVSLHSYSDIRYINGRPEGFGSGSPFQCALSGLVTKGQAALVKDFRLWGQWREVGVEDFARGRVPDSSMMLNTLLRVATDKMVRLQSFSWELDTKPLGALYVGLAAHTTLTALTLSFPSSRVPRPSVAIPPIPNLRLLKILDLDPLCYPDDISMLLLHSRKLEDVRLLFSPRMRREAEPSVNIQTYFGRCNRAGYLPKLKHFAMQNFFGSGVEGIDQLFDPDTCKSVVFIDVFGGVGSSPSTVYVDDQWKQISSSVQTDFRSLRINEVAPQHVELLRRSTGLEKLYIINSRAAKSHNDMASPIGLTPGNTPPRDAGMTQLGKDYLHVLTRHHGQSLKHLLLHDQWALTVEDIANVVRYCPNLEQLGLAMSTSNHRVLRLLMPFLANMKAVRILHNEHVAEHMLMAAEMAILSSDLGHEGCKHLQWLGIADAVYKVGGRYSFVRDDGSSEWRREVTPSSRAEVQHVGIWGLDVLDIMEENGSSEWRREITLS